MALVTGGSRGIGTVIARHFARAGVDVSLTYGSSAERAEAGVALYAMTKAAVAMFLASESARNITGASLVSDGGFAA